MTEEIPAILPNDWEMPRFDRIAVSITPIDEFGLPQNRRGIRTPAPTDPKDYRKFADAIAETVRSTILHILEEKP